MLRIHFSAVDLARVHIAQEPDPLWETTLGIQQLTSRSTGAAVLRAWRQQASAVVERQGLLGSVQLLRLLVPDTGYYPDFLTPAEAGAGLEAGLEAVRDTPTDRLGQELGLLAASTDVDRTARPWLRDLAHGGHSQMGELIRALRTVHGALIAPAVAQAAALIDTDLVVRGRALRGGGIDEMLNSLRPAARWQAPVLEVDYPVTRDIHLGGRGLRLIPSYFCWRTPIALADPGLLPVLVYPVDRALRGAPAEGSTRALEALLGRRRASVLAALRHGATTGEVAGLLGASPASASEHVHVLAAAQLVCSHRSGTRVLHTLTPLGVALLDSQTLSARP